MVMFVDVFEHVLCSFGLRGYPQSLGGYPFALSMLQGYLFNVILTSQGGFGAAPGHSLGLFFLIVFVLVRRRLEISVFVGIGAAIWRPKGIDVLVRCHPFV